MSTIQSVKEAANWALVLNYGDADQAVVSSLFNVQLAGVSRDVLDVVAFREEPRQKSGSKRRTPCTFSGYTILSDPGQLIIKDYLNNKTEFGPVGHANGHCRMYYNLPVDTETASLLTEDFRTLDTARDSLGTYQFLGFTPEAADSNGMFTFNSQLGVGGREAEFYIHYTASTIAFVDSDPDTITDSASGFVTAGFAAGQTLIVEGTSNNDGIYIIDTVIAGTITLTAAGALTAESAGSSFTLHGGK